MKRNTRFLAITASAVFSIAVGVTYFNTNAIGSDSSKLGFESAIAGLDVSFENYYKAGNTVSDKEQVDEVIEEAVRIDEEAKAIEEEYAKELEEAAKREEEALKQENEGNTSKDDATSEKEEVEDGNASEDDEADKEQEQTPVPTPEPESEYKDVGISIADNYVNIRKEPNTECQILGKLYKGCAATILETKGEWVKIKSGSVTGYINANYLAIGFDAEELVDKYAVKYAEVTARTLNVRTKMSTDSRILTQIPKGETYQVLKEYDEWLEVSIDDGDVTGYIAKEYTKISVEFEEAISIEEEQEQIRREEEAKRAEEEQAAKLKKEKEEAAKKAAEEAKKKEEAAKQEAANKKPASTKKPSDNKKPSSNKTESNKTENNKSETTTDKNSSGSDAKRQQVVNYALKFVGNRYVYGGTSLTKGTDCSGFTMSVYKAFGYSIPRTSRTQVGAGTKVKVSTSTLKPGDLLFYCNSSGTINHVAMYIGNGKVVHASNPRSGIKVSKYNYRTPCAARRIIN